MSATWDAIVVGARCAGSPVAMLLARKGHKVLLVDRATFPSDTISTHMIHPPGMEALARWGLVDRLAATGCPPIRRYRFDFGALTLDGSPVTAAAPDLFCPRRTVLDKLLVDAAAEAGAEVREGFVVDGLDFDGDRVVGVRGRAGGHDVTERARVVVGADGRLSAVAKAVRPESYNERPPVQMSYYTYWSGLPTDGFDVYVRPPVGWAAMPTHDGLTLVVVGRQIRELEAMRHDVEGCYLRAFESAPAFAERIRAARREDRFYGTPVDGWFRKPFGPGWVLVGDAAYNKDPITAQGISDAFGDAERCAGALDRALSGSQSLADAMDAVQRERDAHAPPMYEFTYEFASLEPPPPRMQELLGAVGASQESMDDWARVLAGVVSPAVFFAPENVEKIFARAQPAS